MTGTYKEFYKFVKCFNPSICSIWEDFNKRPDPKSGDKFLLKFDSELDKTTYIQVIFDNIEFDSLFRNGVQYRYNFHDNEGNEYTVHSINAVEDPSKLSTDEMENLYGFWRYCIPI